MFEMRLALLEDEDEDRDEGDVEERECGAVGCRREDGENRDAVRCFGRSAEGGGARRPFESSMFAGSAVNAAADSCSFGFVTKSANDAIAR